MINEVKIYDKHGNLKRIIPAEKLKKTYWERFKQEGGNKSIKLRRKQKNEADYYSYE